MTKKQSEAQVSGIVDRLHFASPGFSAGKLRTPEAGPVSFAGPVYFALGDYVTLFGKFEDDAKWGKQFKATRFEFAAGAVAELDEAGLAHYLAVAKEFAGIGPAKAKKLAAAFGTEFATVLENEPWKIAECAGLSDVKVLEVRDAWRASSDKNATATWLASFGLTAHQINSIMDAFGNGTRRILTEDPYRMIDVIDGFGFVRTDEIARKMGVAKERDTRLRAGLVHALKQELEAGHTWTVRDEAVHSANALLCLDGLNGLELIEKELDNLLGAAERDRVAALVEDEAGRVALSQMEMMEGQIRAWLEAAGTRKNPSAPGRDHMSLDGPKRDALNVEAPDPRLNPEQASALRTCLRSNLAVVTGGAGTGKTYLIGAIVRRYREAGRKVVCLCAPTGKAARRISDSLAALGLENEDGATIHRMLGFRGGDGDKAQWGYGPGYPLRADVVICDEASMLDVPLAWRLMRALDLAQTSLILVGDPNQLPPIGAGNVLRDCLTTGLVPVAALTQCVRQAGDLKRNCGAILSGRVAEPETPPGTRDAPWYVIDSPVLSDSGRCADAVIELVEQRVARLQVPVSGRSSNAEDPDSWDLLRDVQVLTPTHKGPLGTAALNVRLQAALQARLFGVAVPAIEEGKRPPFLVGDKVIQTKNDYALGPHGIMNGTLGWILDTDADGDGKGALLVEFDGEAAGPVVVPKKGGKQGFLSLAYALTVHKYQGSEVPVAVCIVHKSHSYQQHQAMVYTACTRARSVCIVIGDAWGIRNAAGKRLVEHRRTFLSLARGPYEPGTSRGAGQLSLAGVIGGAS